MKITTIILCTLSFLFFSACKKKSLNPVDFVIFDLTRSCDGNIKFAGGGEPFFVFASNYKQWLQVNPNNPNEFLYYVPFGLNEKELYTLNRQTLEENLILEKDIQRPPKWGKCGYILFDDNRYVYTIKPNGDSLTIRAKGVNAEWNWAGDKFQFLTSDSITQQYIYVVQDLYTGKKDTINTALSYGCWQNEDNLYLQYSSTGFDVVNMNDYSRASYPSIASTTTPPHLHWISKDEFIYGVSNIYVINTILKPVKIKS